VGVNGTSALGLHHGLLLIRWLRLHKSFIIFQTTGNRNLNIRKRSSQLVSFHFEKSFKVIKFFYIVSQTKTEYLIKLLNMKKLKPLFTALFLLVIVGVKAQTATVDYFAGKWGVLLKGIPQGDTKLVFVLDRKDSTLAGVVQDTTGTEVAKLDKVELADGSITVYFTAQGYDVNLVLNKKDEDHVTGSLMNMFDAEGERIKAK
jgi:hypothetical protein